MFFAPGNLNLKALQTHSYQCFIIFFSPGDWFLARSRHLWTLPSCCGTTVGRGAFLLVLSYCDGCCCCCCCGTTVGRGAFLLVLSSYCDGCCSYLYLCIETSWSWFIFQCWRLTMLFCQGAGHNDVELYNQYLERLKTFVSTELTNWRGPKDPEPAPNCWMPKSRRRRRSSCTSNAHVRTDWEALSKV